ncbi:hypothetical protein FDH02_gp41 [Pseudomonas phage VSW-3]|uniref:Uncharacterized protein n=1 Tax=Pseudomonas phage VSW-3 TaxID=1852562 RepID=A0A173GCT4_9CAUD|nr:hypothetical protein FDH02_gp41 [Pseudomonas phage VSW-3]ANH51117.1 hypothetical protein VSW3_42 [Pseudomonas phage VSW-3]
MTQRIICCKIHLMPAARDRAARALYDGAAYGSKAAKEFTGPDFQDVKGVTHWPDVVRVELKSGDVYTYPIHQVARIKEYSKEVLA